MAAAAPTPRRHGRAKARTAVPPPRPSEADQLRRSDRFAPSTPEATLVQTLRTIWSGRGLRRGTTAVYVVDPLRDEVLFAVHEDRELNPASNVKLPATAAILDVLGPDWRYRTLLLGPTPWPSGVVPGDIYLLGDWDPTFSHRHLAELAAELIARGVTRIDGAVLVGGEAGRDVVADAQVTIAVEGGAVGSPPRVTVTPASDLIALEIAALTTNRLRRPRPRVSGRMSEDGARYVISIDGAIGPGQRVRVRRSVPAADRFTAHTLRAELLAAGIGVRGGVANRRLVDYIAATARGDELAVPVPLAQRVSAPVRSLVARINKPSDNVLADRLLARAGAVRYGGEPTLDKGVRAMKEWLARIGVQPDAVVLDTGSGLSYQSRMSARQIVSVLRAACGDTFVEPATPPATDLPSATDADDLGTVARLLLGELDPMDAALHSHLAVGLDRFARLPMVGHSQPAPLSREEIFCDSLAVAGVDGTLGRRFRNSRLAGRLIGKTGTLKGIIALSGYVTAPSTGNQLVFAIVSNGHRHSRRGQIKRDHAAMVRAMLDYLEARAE
jgi:D-alanyl-D-alanine carboxypeptidase/D-alanyl-D-alanine-endopeptidase (penicillin-binding protein 4)